MVTLKTFLSVIAVVFAYARAQRKYLPMPFCLLSFFPLKQMFDCRYPGYVDNDAWNA